MNLTKENRQVIKVIAQSFSCLKEDWAITGSFNHYLQGIDIVPNDIDIITTKKGIYAISEILNSYCIQNTIYKESKNLKSYFGKFKMQYTKIDIMAEVENKVDNIWLKHQDWENNIVNVKVSPNLILPCLKLNYELLIYQRLRFEERSNLILSYLEDIK